MKIITNLKHGLSFNLVILGFVSLFTDLTSQVIFPLLPLYLTSVLNAQAAIVGMVEGAAETTASFLKLASGVISDRIKKRKIFILIGYGLSSLIKPLFAFATVWPLVLFARVVERMGKGVRDAPRDALIADTVDKKYYGIAFGFHRSMDGLGSMLGAIIAYLLLPILGYEKLFLYTFFPGIVVILLVLFVKEVKHPTEKTPRTKINLVESYKSLPNKLKFFILISTVFALGHFGYAFMLLKSKELLNTDQNSILLYVIFYLTHTVLSIPFGALADKIGKKFVLILGYMVFLLTSFGLMFASNYNFLIVMFVCYGIFYALIDGVQRAFVSEMSPKELKASALGLFHAAIGVIALPAGIIAGSLWDKLGSNYTFIFGCLTTFVALIMLFFVKAPDKEKLGLS